MAEHPVRILIVDDEPQIRRLLRVSLTAQGYETTETALGKDALLRAAVEHPDLVILDLGLPDIDGQEVIVRLREWSDVPIIVLSVREREKDKVAALDSGADDYIAKPFGIDELLARIRAALRHRIQADVKEPVFQAGDVTIDLARRQVSVGDHKVRLTPKEYDLLRVLVTYAGKVVTHRQLLRAVWGPGYATETQYLRVYIGQLREKLEADPSQPRLILTESGVGYRLREGDE